MASTAAPLAAPAINTKALVIPPLGNSVAGAAKVFMDISRNYPCKVVDAGQKIQTYIHGPVAACLRGDAIFGAQSGEAVATWQYLLFNPTGFIVEALHGLNLLNFGLAEGEGDIESVLSADTVERCLKLVIDVCTAGGRPDLAKLWFKIVCLRTQTSYFAEGLEFVPEFSLTPDFTMFTLGNMIYTCRDPLVIEPLRDELKPKMIALSGEPFDMASYAIEIGCKPEFFGPGFAEEVATFTTDMPTLMKAS